MKEFMLLIRNTRESKSDFTDAQHVEFVNQCRVYIDGLIAQGKLIGAQPMVREGVMVSGNGGDWQESPFSESNEVIVGYYHILANDIDDAVSIAKGNPEFAYTNTARVEVRPIKTKEPAIAYQYPGQQSK